MADQKSILNEIRETFEVKSVDSLVGEALSSMSKSLEISIQGKTFNFNFIFD